MADSKLLNRSNSSSPPPNCAICLGSCSNKCFSDTCMHQFCFSCLLEWSKIKAECPLCKQPFKSIIHNVKSNEEYEEHIVEEPRPIHIIDNEQYLYLPQSPPNPSRQHRFHFRTTFTVNTHGENAIQQMLLSHSLTNGISISNYMPGPWPQYRRNRRDISTTTGFRRSIYNNNLWASAPADVSGRYREVTPDYFQANPASRTRLVPWLNRELNALLHENTQDVMELVDRIMDYLLRYHICSRSFRNLLQTYLGERTDHFVHEFYNFMRSPFDMIGYDRHVIYLERPTSPTPFIDISEDDSSDVMIVEENPVVIEVLSSDSDDDVIMTSLPGQIPKPQLLPPCRRSRKRSRQIELSSRSSSSSSSRSSKERKEERRRDRRKKRKLSSNEKKKKNRPFKLEDFVMDDSSSSELDDLPLAKYLRIKASIGKRILKRSSQLVTSKKTKSRKKNHADRFPSSKSKRNNSKFIDLVCPSPKPHCSKYIPRRRDSSSSSSSSSNTTSSRCITQLRHSTSSSSATISLSNTPPLLTLISKERINHFNEQPSSTSRSVDYNCSEDARDADIYGTRYESSSRKDRHSNNTSKNQGASWSDRPSTSSFRDRLRTNSPKKEPQSFKMKIKSRFCGNAGQDMNLEQPLELTNHCRYSLPQSNPYAVPYVPSPPLLLGVNSNPSRNPVNVSQSVNFYNSPQSPDLIDLSVSKMKTENICPDTFSSANSSSHHHNPYHLDNQLKSCESRQRFTPNNQHPCASTSQQTSSNQINYPNPFLHKREPKTEPLMSDYNAENFNRYWTDFAQPNSGLASSNDSSSYDYFSNQPRKSVIQNFSNNLDYYVPYNSDISPRWSCPPTPTPQTCSDSSD